MARISLAREADCKPAVAGFDSQARLHGPLVQGTGQLSPKEQARVRIAPDRRWCSRPWHN